MLSCSFNSQCNFVRTLRVSIRSIIEISQSSLNFFNIQIEKLFKVIFSVVFNLNHQHFLSSLSYAKHKYFYSFLGTQIH